MIAPVLPRSAFPFSTPYDPLEDPPTSIDPLGTVAEAERLADLLLPGMTARMWRARFLTFSAVAALVADRTVDLAGRDDIRDDARLAFERLFVSALVRRAGDDGMVQAMRRVPGTDRARTALRAAEPLTRANFLKGQAINGPTGVMARLSRHIGVTDDEHRLGPRGLELVLAWSGDEVLPGALEGRRDAGDGGRWITQMAQATRDALNGVWPGNQAGLWQELAQRLRPDAIGKNERKILEKLLWSDALGLRGRTLDLIKAAERTYRESKAEGRGVAERAVLQDGVKPKLEDTPTDRVLHVVVDSVEAFEKCACFLQAVFDTLRWALSSSGTMPAHRVLADGRTLKNLERVRKRIPNAVASLEGALSRMAAEPAIERDAIEPLRQLRDDASRGIESAETLLEAVLDRHDRVQREKRKGRWIERSEQLTLMPGFGLDEEKPPFYDRLYLHPFRIVNTYVMLGDLGLVRGAQDVEE